MPNIKRRAIAGAGNFEKRGRFEVDFNNNDTIDQHEETDQLNASFNQSLDLNDHDDQYGQRDQSTQTDWDFTMDKCVQTEPSIAVSNSINSIEKQADLDLVRDLLCIFQDLCVDFKAKHLRVLSVSIFTLLRLCGVKFGDVRAIFNKLELLGVQRCYSWFETIVEENPIVILRDGRGQYERISFYDSFPELEIKAKAFAVEGGSRKNASFTCKELAIFVNDQFKELYPDYVHPDLSQNDLVRSVASCRVDVMKWGGVWEKNTNRPYFLGHEAEENARARERFCDYFLDRQDFYYYPLRDQNQWNEPLRNSTILISHDESTFRSGENQLFRWLFPNSAPLFNKGRGRSVMVSEFLVQHEEALFRLDEDEWTEAVRIHPELKNNDDFLNYYSQSASSWIEPKKDCYFDNEQILKQFERLFILIKFKKSYAHHKIEIIVDHATTHTAKQYDVNCFNKKPGTNCPYNQIEWLEDNGRKIVSCVDQDGTYRGLEAILEDLNIEFEDNLRLPQLRSLLKMHPAFEDTSRLDRLASEYGHKIIWCPKYHCEMSPVEGYWCCKKQFVRKHNDQDFNKFHSLLIAARNNFVASNNNIKLWNRFWKCLQMYKDGASYSDVLTTLFGAKSRADVVSHKKNTFFNTNL